MSRSEQPRTEIVIEAGPASGPPRRPRSAGPAVAAIVAIGAFVSGYATGAGPAHDAPNTSAASAPAVAHAPRDPSSAAPLTLPPDGGDGDAAVFLGAYPRALVPACNVSSAADVDRDTE